MIYVYRISLPVLNQTDETTLIEDIAFTVAFNKKQATKKFKRFYSEVNVDNVTNTTGRLLRCAFRRKVCFLDDY